MADFLLLGLFDNVEVTANVLDELRREGVEDDQVTIMSNIPYAAKYFGRKPHRSMFLPFVLGGIALGVLIAVFISVITPQLYPIYVGNQGLTPVPPSAIMFFEFISLSTMLVAFFGFLLQNRFPILVREMYDDRITDGYIGVQVRAESSLAEKVAAVFENFHAHLIKREDAAEYKPQGMRHLFFWGGLGTVGLVALLAPLLLTYGIIDLPWINTMDDSIAVEPQEGPRRAAPDEAVPVQGPRLISGQPATQPQEATEDSIMRGGMLFSVHCAICHGVTAQGDGTLSKFYTADHGFPRGVPALAGRDLPGDYIFIVVTNGIVGADPETGEPSYRMPRLVDNVTPAETWDIVNYIHSLGAE